MNFLVAKVFANFLKYFLENKTLNNMGFFHQVCRNSPVLQKLKKLEKKIHWIIPDGKKKDTSSAEYVTLQKYFSSPSFSYLLLTTRVIANHLDQSLW
jgi:hypothetical protein